ncbi:MAG: Eco57I restriction-modification methylase domain-containing protein [Clostridia bacterium]|nr:Eco57I restriction-modification methylase domain-containing protein [Clostridia bacterium]
MKLKENATQKKLRGGYYTPQKLADYITKVTLKDEMKILEPSCGDGSFLRSIKRILNDKNYNIEKIDAVEYIEEEANKSEKIIEDIENATVINDDFYNFYVNCKDKYNLIIGNPPYIRYQYLTTFQREKQSQVLIKNKMKSNKLINSWVFFLVACIELLEKNGTIAFVIPAEIMQVAYAEDLRKYLSKHLSKINIISFNELLFEDAEQEVVVLIGIKKDKKSECLISNCLYDNVNDFIKNYNENNLNYEKILTNDKWTRYYLNENENNVIEEVKKDSRFRRIGDIGLVNVGITTGNNDYFSLDDNYVKKYDLKKYTKPLIGRSSQTHGLVFNEDDWNKNVNKGVKAYLLTINEDVDVKDMSKGQQEYIKIGEDNEENKGYKCRIRKKWYSVPSIWVPDAFLLRRSNVYPKFVLNGIDAVSTDTMHRIKIKEEYDNKKILLSYYNSISFAFTELCGRSYGGGVLEILPKEAENIMIPNIDDMDEQNVNRLIGILDENIRNKKDIREAINVMDKEILENYLGISPDIIIMYRDIWKTLNNRRMNRK